MRFVMTTDERREQFRRDLTRAFRCYARFYDLIEWVMPLVRHNPRTVIAQAVDVDAETILDACTGNGAVLAELAASRPDAALFGLDLSPDMLALASRRVRRRGLSNVQILSGDCTKMPFPDATFDALTASYGLHEMPAELRVATVDEALRVLKPGRKLAVIDWDQPHSRLQRLVAPLRAAVEPGWIAELYGEGLAKILESTGFTNVTIERRVFLSQLVIGTKPS